MCCSVPIVCIFKLVSFHLKFLITIKLIYHLPVSEVTVVIIIFNNQKDDLRLKKNGHIYITQTITKTNK